jgi:hypothetical protein
MVLSSRLPKFYLQTVNIHTPSILLSCYIILQEALSYKFIGLKFRHWFFAIIRYNSISIYKLLIFKLLKGAYMKNFNLTRILDRLFVILVLIMLVIPLAKFNLSERSVEENRMLKKWPVWSDFHVLKGDNYFKAFENWFNDRFNQRDRLTRYAFNLDARINNTHENDHALMGKENWIFTKERNSIGNFQNTSALTPNEKEHPFALPLPALIIGAKIIISSFMSILLLIKTRFMGNFIPIKLKK